MKMAWRGCGEGGGGGRAAVIAASLRPVGHRPRRIKLQHKAPSKGIEKHCHQDGRGGPPRWLRFKKTHIERKITNERTPWTTGRAKKTPQQKATFGHPKVANLPSCLSFGVWMRHGGNMARCFCIPTTLSEPSWNTACQSCPIRATNLPLRRHLHHRHPQRKLHQHQKRNHYWRQKQHQEPNRRH
jgi:hypothetical protein